MPSERSLTSRGCCCSWLEHLRGRRLSELRALLGLGQHTQFLHPPLADAFSNLNMTFTEKKHSNTTFWLLGQDSLGNVVENRASKARFFPQERRNPQRCSVLKFKPWKFKFQVKFNPIKTWSVLTNTHRFWRILLSSGLFCFIRLPVTFPRSLSVSLTTTLVPLAIICYKISHSIHSNQWLEDTYPSIRNGDSHRAAEFNCNCHNH